MIALKDRIRMALNAFCCRPFEMVVEPYHDNGELSPGVKCDSNWRGDREECGNNAVICLSRTVAVFKLERDDHEHLCGDCADKIEGKFSTEALDEQ